MNQRITFDDTPRQMHELNGVRVNMLLRCVEPCNDSGDAAFRDEDTGEFYEIPTCKIICKGDGK